MPVYILQYLCPRRHAIMAAVLTDLAEEENAKREIRQLVHESGQVNPWCAMCGSKDLAFELGKTKFATVEEAMPLIKQLEAQQMVTNALFGRY